jgi:protoporphyrinogen oxidase
MTPPENVVIIGAGPAGLTAAYRAVESGLAPIVLEQRDKVGGIASTETHGGFYFDMGGHRFFSTHPEIYEIWNTILDTDFLTRSRLSRIYYGGKFYDYPMKPANALKNIGPFTACLFVQSYLWWHLFPHKREDTFEQWVTNRFGKRLFNAFFKSYTEKVWGISCSELRAEWAAQRIKNLTLKKTITNMLSLSTKRVRSLIDEFHYPSKGPGMMWNAAAAWIEGKGGTVRLNHKVASIRRQGRRITAIDDLPADHVISSMPLTSFIRTLDPAPEDEVVEAAAKLRYRAFLTVCLILDKEELFPDQWLYIHDPGVKMGRIQNYKNWSPHMVPDRKKTGLGLEYFCDEGDALWSLPDEALIDLGTKELEIMKMVEPGQVTGGAVYRVPKAYPVYTEDYRANLDVIRGFVDGLENFQTIGRNGLFRYNNMDHSMLTAIYAVDNLEGKERRDVWSVNEEQAYHEEVLEDADFPEIAFRKVDRLAMGVAVGAVFGAGLFLMTIILVLKGGEVVGPNLALLGQYFPGYTVTPLGGLLGVGYGFASGFVVGWFGAFMRNLVVVSVWIAGRFKTRRTVLRRLLDYI